MSLVPQDRFLGVSLEEFSVPRGCSGIFWWCRGVAVRFLSSPQSSRPQGCPFRSYSSDFSDIHVKLSSFSSQGFGKRAVFIFSEFKSRGWERTGNVSLKVLTRYRRKRKASGTQSSLQVDNTTSRTTNEPSGSSAGLSKFLLKRHLGVGIKVQKGKLLPGISAPHMAVRVHILAPPLPVQSCEGGRPWPKDLNPRC